MKKSSRQTIFSVSLSTQTIFCRLHLPVDSFFVCSKFCFPRIVLNRKYPCITSHHPKETRVSRDAQNVCAVTKVGTVLKRPKCFF